MTFFSELYSAYYHAMAQVLKTAVDHPLKKDEIREIIEGSTFGESALNIIPAIEDERWQLLRSDGTTPIKHAPTMPMTLLEKRWIKAVYQDPRIRLFTDDTDIYPDVEPLFYPGDVLSFDAYADGDPYTDEEYIRNVRLAMDAIRNQYPLEVENTNSRGRILRRVIMPRHLEYSEKDDKFRLIGDGISQSETINIARIVSIKPYKGTYEPGTRKIRRSKKRMVRFELTDERKALERVMMHFAHFEKQAERIDEKCYNVTVMYDKDDETEMVIRILSFGPMVKVTAPQHFVELIKERLIKQRDYDRNCGL